MVRRHAGYRIGCHNPSTCCVVTFVFYIRLTVFVIIGIIGLGLRFEVLFAGTVVGVIRGSMIMVGCMRRIGGLMLSSKSHHLRSDTLVIGS